jgi:hypothetical protein
MNPATAITSTAIRTAAVSWAPVRLFDVPFMESPRLRRKIAAACCDGTKIAVDFTPGGAPRDYQFRPACNMVRP